MRARVRKSRDSDGARRTPRAKTPSRGRAGAGRAPAGARGAARERSERSARQAARAAFLKLFTGIASWQRATARVSKAGERRGDACAPEQPCSFEWAAGALLDTHQRTPDSALSVNYPKSAARDRRAKGARRTFACMQTVTFHACPVRSGHVRARTHSNNQGPLGFRFTPALLLGLTSSHKGGYDGGEARDPHAPTGAPPVCPPPEKSHPGARARQRPSVSLRAAQHGRRSPASHPAQVRLLNTDGHRHKPNLRCAAPGPASGERRAATARCAGLNRTHATSASCSEARRRTHGAWQPTEGPARRPWNAQPTTRGPPPAAGACRAPSGGGSRAVSRNGRGSCAAKVRARATTVPGVALTGNTPGAAAREAA